MRLIVSFLKSEGKLDLNNQCVRNNISSDCWFVTKLNMVLSP
jgi:hypothetical protein